MSFRRERYSSRPRSPPRRSRRSESPERSRDRLPTSFDTQRSRRFVTQNVLQLMETYEEGPMVALNTYRKSSTKVKVWTRNFSEIRGILNGYIVSFDRHWNLILRDVTDTFLVSKKNKTPFLRKLESGEELPDMPVKVPRQNKAVTEPPPPPPEPKEPKEPKKSKKKPKCHVKFNKRHVGQMFIRGSNIVMISPLSCSDDEDDAGEIEIKCESSTND